MSSDRYFPAIPDPTSDPASLYQTSVALKQVVENLTGDRGPDSTTALTTTSLVSGAGLADAQKRELVRNVGATPAPQFPSPCGRLTISSGNPVYLANVSVATIYYTPYTGNVIWLYTGSIWVSRTFTETALPLAGGTANKPNDIFAYDNSGTLALELLAWTSTTDRATGLAYQDGILVKSGEPTRRYLGTVHIFDSGGTKYTIMRNGGDAATNTDAVFWVWNYYNRIRYVARTACSTGSWSGTSTNTWGAAGGYSWYGTRWVCGVAEDSVEMEYKTLMYVTSGYAVISIGIDGVSGAAVVGDYDYATGSVYSNVTTNFSYAGVGSHQAVGIEFSTAGSSTIYGSVHGAFYFSGFF